MKKRKEIYPKLNQAEVINMCKLRILFSGTS